MTERPWVSGGATLPDPAAREHTVTTPDGRTLGVAEYGPADGFPVFGLHGTPGSRYAGPPPDQPDLYDRYGMRSLHYDRPGYGRSDRHPGRSVADAARDVAAIADRLGLERFAVHGGSGGGPHALAVATLLPDRVRRAACVVGVAPVGADGLGRDDWLAGMTKGNVDEFTWAESGEAVLRPHLEQLAAGDLARVAADPSRPFDESYELAAADQAILARPAVQERTARTMQEALRRGVDGWLDDSLAFVRPWGFPLAALQVPTMVWFGLDDTLVPAAHGEWLAAHVPGAAVLRMTGGHLELVNRAEDLVRWMVRGELPADASDA